MTILHHGQRVSEATRHPSDDDPGRPFRLDDPPRVPPRVSVPTTALRPTIETVDGLALVVDRAARWSSDVAIVVARMAVCLPELHRNGPTWPLVDRCADAAVELSDLAGQASWHSSAVLVAANNARQSIRSDAA